MKKIILSLVLLFSITLSFGQVSSVNLITGTSGVDVNSSVAQSTTNPVITLNIPNASATARGLVTTGNQTFSGTKTFNNGAEFNGSVDGNVTSLKVHGEISMDQFGAINIGSGYIYGGYNEIGIRGSNVGIIGDTDSWSSIFLNESAVDINAKWNTVFRINGGLDENERVRMIINPNGNISFDTTDVLGLGGNGGIFNIQGNTSISGNVGIGGVMNSTDKLAVNGIVHAKEVRVNLDGWPDYVFKEDYKLPTLQEVENQIKEKGHLHNIPSAKEVSENGILVGDMNTKLLQKIEELTLYIIEQEARIKKLEAAMPSK